MGKFTMKASIDKLAREIEGYERNNKNRGCGNVGHEIFRFFNSDLQVFGAVIVPRGDAPASIFDGFSQSIFKLVIEYGATNSIFLLNTGKRREPGKKYFRGGWVYWNSIQVSFHNIFASDSDTLVYEEGIRNIFRMVDEMRFACKMDQLGHKRLQNLGATFKPE